MDGGDEKIRASKDMIDLYQCTDKEGEMKVIRNIFIENNISRYPDKSCEVWKPLQD